MLKNFKNQISTKFDALVFNNHFYLLREVTHFLKHKYHL